MLKGLLADISQAKVWEDPECKLHLNDNLNASHGFIDSLCCRPLWVTCKVTAAHHPLTSIAAAILVKPTIRLQRWG